MGFRMGEIRVRSVDQKRREAFPFPETRPQPHPFLHGPSPQPPNFHTAQKVFLHPELSLSSLAVQHPWVEPQALDLA